MGALGLWSLLGPGSEDLGPPMDEIDHRDRARLEAVLEAAERQERER